MLERIRARRAWGAGAQARPLVTDSATLAPISPTIPSKETCASIASLASLAGLPHYPTAISSATVVPASPGNATTPPNPDYCNVQGMIAPQTHFDLQLPLTTWPGRYLQNGCGGYCGTVEGQTFPTCDATREAMEMAERYPDDFDGIIAGAPEIIAGPLNAEAQTWFCKVNTDANGNAILTDNKLAALQAAVIKACGGDDGVAGDGIITDPQDCHFDPASIECAAGAEDNSCLTPAQVQVVREFYRGPTDPQGRLLYPGGAPYGSEGGWSVFELPPSPNGGNAGRSTTTTRWRRATGATGGRRTLPACSWSRPSTTAAAVTRVPFNPT
jgi:hypothetical protein